MAGKNSKKGFGSSQLSNMTAVGAVSPSSARIWVRSDKKGDLTVRIFSKAGRIPKREERLTVNSESDFTGVALLDDLEPLTRYRYEVRRKESNRLVGKGFFETFPVSLKETPKKFTFALMSCHQPFNEDTGEPEHKRLRLLRVVPKILADHDVKFILLGGDQIYSDHPHEYSLFRRHYTDKLSYHPGKNLLEWDETTIRRAFQERYRIFLNFREMRKFYANHPCYPIFDDHEIVDDWGSEEEHLKREYQTLLKGSLAAYDDYQGSRVNGTGQPYYYSFAYGSIGLFVMDLRTGRTAKVRERRGRLFSQQQFKDLSKFLSANADKKVIFIVTSVPVFHLAEWKTNVGALFLGEKLDFKDHWACEGNRLERDRFLHLLYCFQKENSKTSVVLLGGDVHIGCAFEVRWRGKDQPRLYQFTSSAISNRMKKYESTIHAKYLGKKGSVGCEIKEWKKKADVFMMKPVNNDGQNPFGGLNIGLVDVESAGEEAKITFRLMGYPEGHPEGKYQEFFRSKMI